jgi:hypothetical protein
MYKLTKILQKPESHSTLHALRQQNRHKKQKEYASQNVPYCLPDCLAYNPWDTYIEVKLCYTGILA